MNSKRIEKKNNIMRIFKWLFRNRKTSKKQVVDQYKINDVQVSF